MSQVVLDTDVVSLHRRRQLSAEVRHHLIGHDPYVSFATAGELQQWAVTRHWGWARRTSLQLWLELKRVLPYSLEVARVWGDIAGRAVLRGRTLPANDLWIAACCMERGLPLLTLNRRDFEELERHEGLRLLPPGAGSPPGGIEVRSPVPVYSVLSSSTRTAGRPALACSQEAPASWDR